MPQPGIVEIDLHGKNAYQARVLLDAALRRADKSVAILRVVHGSHMGTRLSELVRTEYGNHPRVQRVIPMGDNATNLILRSL